MAVLYQTTVNVRHAGKVHVVCLLEYLGANYSLIVMSTPVNKCFSKNCIYINFNIFPIVVDASTRGGHVQYRYMKNVFLNRHYTM